MSKKLRYKVKRGKERGIYLYPHRYADGGYVVSQTRYEEDQDKVASENQLLKYVARTSGSASALVFH